MLRPASQLRTWLSEHHPGTYGDGRPFDGIGYLQCKLMLKPDHFTSAGVFREFAALVERAAARADIRCESTPKSLVHPAIREVVFFDTNAHDLYNNAFILRRRILYQDGFPTDDPEIVCKYRSDDMATAQSVDMRPRIDGRYRVKLKLEIMPLKDRLGGMRRLLSHNVELTLSSAPQISHLVTGPRVAVNMADLAAMFPALARLPATTPAKVSMVNRTVVEEVLQDICTLSLHHHTTATASLALWRSRGDQRGFVGEFAFQLRFPNPAELSDRTLAACEDLLIELQAVAADWLELASTKTGLLYRLRGNLPQSHE